MSAKYIKKIYISLMSIVLLMLTAVTTTFAWVGFLNNSFFDDFDIDLSANELGEYGLEVSLTGEKDTFSNTIDEIELKRQVLKNAEYPGVDNMSDEQVEKANFSMDQCTVQRTDNALGEFMDIKGNYTKNYFKFSIYMRSRKNAEINPDDQSTYYMDAFLNDNIFIGVSKTNKLMNDFTYPTINGNIIYPATYYDSYNNGLYEMTYPSFTSNNLIKNPNVSGNITVNPVSASRLAIEVHKPVDMYDTKAFYGINNTIIYQGGTQYPTYNSQTKEYSFGGILPDDYNVAIYDYNNKILEGYTAKSVPKWALERGDLEFVNDGITNRIIDSNDSKVGIDQMIKMTFYFWYEGWDADCFSIINQMPVSINLSFSNYHH